MAEEAGITNEEEIVRKFNGDIDVLNKLIKTNTI
jgi:hypothetical protein